MLTEEFNDFTIDIKNLDLADKKGKKKASNFSFDLNKSRINQSEKDLVYVNSKNGSNLNFLIQEKAKNDKDDGTTLQCRGEGLNIAKNYQKSSDWHPKQN